MPEYLVYSHISHAPPPITWGEGTAKVKVPKTRFHPLTPIAPKTLAALAEDTPLLQIGKPVGNIEELPRDSKGVQRRQCWVGVGLKVPAGNNGSAGSTAAEWPLWQWKVIQRRSGRDWEIERVIVR
jgi:ATP-dependent RNA helicase DHX37/DHR1